MFAWNADLLFSFFIENSLEMLDRILRNAKISSCTLESVFTNILLHLMVSLVFFYTIYSKKKVTSFKIKVELLL